VIRRESGKGVKTLVRPALYPFGMSKKPPLSETHPEIAKEADGWDPEGFSHGSDKKMYWKCNLGHEYRAAIKHRTFSRSGCPYCANQKILSGFNDLGTVDKELSLEAYGWDPSLEFSSSSRSREWKCEQAHVFEATIRNRRRGDGCPYCSGRRVTKGKNDLKSINPTVAAELVDLDPTSISAGSGKRATWVCSFGHNWKTSIANRALSGTGCPVCNGQQLEIGFNDLLTKFPEVALEADGWDPSLILAGSHARKKWKCTSAHQWEATIDHRTQKSSGCPYCSGRYAITGENDIATLFPDVARQAVGWDPSEELPNSAKRVQWKCSEGHEWKAKIYSRFASRQEGCPTCATTGFDPNKDGWLYFLEHPDWEMLQIGITNVPEGRLAIHKRLGWNLLELRGPMDGDLARQWETDILRMLKRKNANLGNTTIAGTYSGYTEAWLKNSHPVSSLKELMEEVRIDEEKSEK
jgi:DNA-directed RNA polymerase subunit RPC12/RpoP